MKDSTRLWISGGAGALAAAVPWMLKNDDEKSKEDNTLAKAIGSIVLAGTVGFGTYYGIGALGGADKSDKKSVDKPQEQVTGGDKSGQGSSNLSAAESRNVRAKEARAFAQADAAKRVADEVPWYVDLFISQHASKAAEEAKTHANQVQYEGWVARVGERKANEYRKERDAGSRSISKMPERSYLDDLKGLFSKKSVVLPWNW